MKFGTILDYTYNRNQGVKLTILSMGFLTGDKEGHTFRIAVVDRQGPVDLTGASVTGWFIPNDQGLVDDQSVPLKGSVEGNVAILSLPPEVYLEEGRFSLVIKLNHDGRISTIFWGTGSVSRSNTDVYVDVGDVIPSLEELLAQIDKMEEATKETKDATSAANAATDRANAAADSVDELKVDAEQAIDEAQTAVKKAGEITASWENATAQATTVDYDVPASAELSMDENGNRLFLFNVPRGVPGKDGYTPQKGVDYFDGYTPQKGVDYFDGKPGEPGKNFTILGLYDTFEALKNVHPTGSAGDAYAVGTSESNEVYTWDVDAGAWVNLGALQGPEGPEGPQGLTGPEGPQGPKGDKPVKGTDYFTADDKAQIVQDVLNELPEQGGTGVPDGGTTGQMLFKTSDEDGAAEWQTPTHTKVGALGSNPNEDSGETPEMGSVPNHADTAGKAYDADKLGGVNASGYALKTDTAPDSEKLGGVEPAGYVTHGELAVMVKTVTLEHQSDVSSGSNAQWTYTLDIPDGYTAHVLSVHIINTTNNSYGKVSFTFDFTSPTLKVSVFNSNESGVVKPNPKCTYMLVKEVG